MKDKSAANLVINYFERVPTIVTDLLLAADPVVPAEMLLGVQNMLGSAAMNCFRSGWAYLVRLDGELSSPETSAVFDGADGEIYITNIGTSLDTPDTMPDYIDIVAISPTVAVSNGARRTAPAGSTRSSQHRTRWMRPSRWRPGLPSSRAGAAACTTRWPHPSWRWR